MKYLALVYLSQEKWNACDDQLCFDAAKTIRDSGNLLAAEPLHPIETATTLRVRNGQLSVTDGPFAETKEQLGGYYIIEVPDLDAAIKWAAKIPSALNGSIEIRPLASGEASA